MIIFLLSILLIFITSYSYGIIFKQFFFKKYDFLFFDLGETTILGFFFLSIISIFLHFFMPINYLLTILILIIGLFYFIINFHQFRQSNLSTFLILFSIIFIGFVSSKNHPDFEWYHLPYLNYIQNYSLMEECLNFVLVIVFLI